MAPVIRARESSADRTGASGSIVVMGFATVDGAIVPVEDGAAAPAASLHTSSCGLLVCVCVCFSFYFLYDCEEY